MKFSLNSSKALGVFLVFLLFVVVGALFAETLIPKTDSAEGPLNIIVVYLDDMMLEQ